MSAMKKPPEPPEPYVTVLNDIKAIEAAMRRLETHVLQLMRAHGLSDEDMSHDLDITPQMVGRKRRRKV